MAPGGSVYQDITESRAALADYDIAPTNMEFRSSSYRKPATVGGKGGMASNIAMHDLFDCPVCMNSMYPPINQCPNGHTLCQNCKAKVHNVCPICRQELGNIRCLALEKVAESLELPCKYQFLGCEEIFSYQSRLRHEQNCRTIISGTALIIALMPELNALYQAISCSLLSILRMITMLICMMEAPSTIGM